MNNTLQSFSISEELHKTIVQSLISSFGLDFLLLEDKKGGDVDTINNVRQDIYATEKEKQRYNNREAYDSYAYHTDENYIKKGREDKKKHQKGELFDSYRNENMTLYEKRQLDHTISASEIHNDRGRILAEKNGVELANKDSNLNSTHWYINNIKRDHTIEKCVNEIFPKKIDNLKKTVEANNKKLQSMPSNNPKERDEKRQMELKIKKDKEKIEALNEAIDNKDAMLKVDKKARDDYDKEINKAYYTSSKFFKNTAVSAVNTGVRMGARQAIGLILAEIWFELKESIPKIYKENKNNFEFQKFIDHIKETLQSIFIRVKNRYHDLIMTFKNSAIAGTISSISTTLTNIFLTTEKIIVRLIRESWNSLAEAAKLIFFNPDRLLLGDLTKEVFRVLGLGVSIALGAILNQHLNSLMTFPFGIEVAAFLSAVVTGIMTIGMIYYLDHSETMKKFWDYLNNLKSKYKNILDNYKQINEELNYYLIRLGQIEFNIDADGIQLLTDSLAATDCEYQRSLILQKEINHRNIELPYEADNLDSVRQWLSQL